MTDEPATLPTNVEPPPPPREEPRKTAVPGAAPGGARRTGVVFVHGIGTQVARETLFDWARPIIDVLGEWRREYDRAHPTRRSARTRSAPRASATPRTRGSRSMSRSSAIGTASSGCFTEAYWAGDVRPPSFTAAARYLLRQIPGIASGIAKGYGVREQCRADRLNALIDQYQADPDPTVRSRVDEIRLSLSSRWRITDFLDSVWQQPVVRALLGGMGTVAALTVLGIYSALHAIPIGAIRKRVEIAMADMFIVEWFGDLPGDPRRPVAVRRDPDATRRARRVAARARVSGRRARRPLRRDDRQLRDAAALRPRRVQGGQARHARRGDQARLAARG